MVNKYLLAVSIGILMLIISMGLNTIFSAFFPDLQQEYLSPVFRPWNDPIMSLFFLYPIVMGVMLTWVWFKTRKSWSSGLEFGLTMAVLFSIPSFIVNFSSFTFSFLMVMSWTVFGFINVLAAGFALEKFEK